jgi:hypothetical protein
MTQPAALFHCLVASTEAAAASQQSKRPVSGVLMLVCAAEKDPCW